MPTAAAGVDASFIVDSRSALKTMGASGAADDVGLGSSILDVVMNGMAARKECRRSR